MCSFGVPDKRNFPPRTRRSSDDVDFVSWVAKMSILLVLAKLANASCLPWPMKVSTLGVTICR